MRHGKGSLTGVLGGMALVLVAGVMAGCLAYRPYWNPGGSGISQDQYTYVSTPYQPMTVTLLDVRTGEAIWSTDIPVGKQLSIGFYADHDTENEHTPDLMRWSIQEAGQRHGRLRNAMPVPHAGARRLDLEIRKAPEFPG